MSFDANYGQEERTVLNVVRVAAEGDDENRCAIVARDVGRAARIVERVLNDFLDAERMLAERVRGRLWKLMRPLQPDGSETQTLGTLALLRATPHDVSDLRGRRFYHVGVLDDVPTTPEMGEAIGRLVDDLRPEPVDEFVQELRRLKGTIV